MAPPVSLEWVLDDPEAAPSCPAINCPVPNPTPPPAAPDQFNEMKQIYNRIRGDSPSIINRGQF